MSELTGQVGKVLGERWKALNDKQRSPYEAKAKADKERYESEKAAYNVRAPHLFWISRKEWNWEPTDPLVNRAVMTKRRSRALVSGENGRPGFSLSLGPMLAVAFESTVFVARGFLLHSECTW